MATEEKQPSKTSVQKIEPARALSPFEEMDRLFDAFSSHSWFRPFQMEWPRLHKGVTPFEGKMPDVDIIERDDEVVIKAEMPGVDKKDIDISVTQNSVTIKGTASHEEKEERGDYYRCEISRGSYARTMSLPAEVDETKSKATYKDGVLQLTLPKLKKSKRHSIKVE